MWRCPLYVHSPSPFSPWVPVACVCVTHRGDRGRGQLSFFESESESLPSPTWTDPPDPSNDQMALPEDPNEWTPEDHRRAKPAQRNEAADQLQEEHPDWRELVWDLADPAWSWTPSPSSRPGKAQDHDHDMTMTKPVFLNTTNLSMARAATNVRLRRVGWGDKGRHECQGRDDGVHVPLLTRAPTPTSQQLTACTGTPITAGGPPPITAAIAIWVSHQGRTQRPT